MKKTLVITAALLFLTGIITNGGASAMDKKNVVLETNQGVIEIELMPDVAPKACENFTKLAEKGYYNGLIFHRVIKGFMIQGGVNMAIISKNSYTSTGTFTYKGYYPAYNVLLENLPNYAF